MAGRGKGITLKGAAAGAYRGADGQACDDGQSLRVATLVHMEMSGGRTEVAMALIRAVARDGLEATAKTCTASKGG